MSRLFGVEVGTLSVVLAIAVGVALVVVAALAVRNRIFFKLGVRNMTRRRARSAIVVAGLMLGTAIIASALGTGDTMATTVRSSVLTSRGNVDEVVSARSADSAATAALGPLGGPASSVRYLTPAEAGTVVAAARRSKLVDGAAPAIVEPVAVQDAASRQTQSRVTLFATDPAVMGGFGTIRGTDGHEVSLGSLQSGQVYLNRKAADELSARVGDTLTVLAAGKASTAAVQGIVTYDGTGTDSYALLMPLAAAQQVLGVGDLVQEVHISNTGDAVSGAAHSAAVVELLAPVAGPGLQVDPVKRNELENADKQGAALMAPFTTFGTFTIAAGILLIFLIFVMLAAERRGEMGTARAVGTQRANLIEMFLFEGMAYDLISAAVGAVLGLAVALAMVRVLAGALASSGLDIRYSLQPRSLLLAYSIGMLLTFVVVTVSAWKVSRLNVVSAIRSLPEPPKPHRRRARWALGLAGLAVGGLMTAGGIGGAQASNFLAGVGIMLMSLIPLARAAGLNDRIAYTLGGGGLVVWSLLPFHVYQSMVPGMKMDFSVWVFVGLLLVVGVTWVVIYNASALLGVAVWAFGRIRALAPVLKTSVAQSLRNRFRTGTTIALFTLVVFVLVTGVSTSNAFIAAMNDNAAFGGGFQVQATTSPASPVTDMASALRQAPGIRPSDITAFAGQSVLPLKVRQGDSGTFETHPVRALDDAFTAKTTYGFAAMARGYTSSRQVWDAVATQPNLAVVDPLVVPRRTNWNFAAPPKFHITGFFLEDKAFDPIPVQVQDPQTGTPISLTVIGVLKDTAVANMTGISTARRNLASLGAQVQPNLWDFTVARGVDPVAEAKALGSAFLANGMQAKALSESLRAMVSTSLTFEWLILGFLGLGLIIGVAALGVISARAVVERRQQIGVLRAIGFQRRMVQLSFLIESAFVTLVGILVGTSLGLVVAFNVVSDAARQPTWDTIRFAPPLLSLGAILLVVFLASLATTYLPARRASRIYPAMALRYE